MIVRSRKPLTIAEVKSYVKSVENQNLQDYLKKFSKISKEDAEKLAKEITDLNNLKIKEENIVKIIDLLPQDSEDINKIFTEATLSEDEANSIIQIVGKYK